MSDSETFTIRLYITGLALFVPHRDAVHVLLPATTPNIPEKERQTHDHHQNPADCGGAEGDNKHLAKIYHAHGEIDFDGYRLEIGGGDTLHPEIPLSVMSITTPIPAQQIDYQKQTNVAAHLVLKTGKAGPIGARGAFTVDDQRQPGLTNSLCWIISGVRGSSLSLQRVGLLDGSVSTCTLQPDEGEIALHLLNIPEHEHALPCPGRPECDDDAPHHFSMYGVLFDNVKLPKVRCRKEPHAGPQWSKDPPGPALCKHIVAKVIYTCMIAQTTVA